ncbi:hypothetical protein [Spirosoma rhododendri]|uniref:Uncharacterized protein n=1 Tax=Spirosoma rhododendri TaxID=2728024 RepID=A0A7L5DKZ4_9BACT|nr:hypothetical protein [Spirosoma rhododendri]QJD79154.1 hypothetical protein HH216_12545 [Spirosoma rhododendri]
MSVESRSYKISVMIFIAIISIFLGLGYLQDRELDEKLTECSKFTFATVTRAYRKGGMPHVTYVFKNNGKIYENDESIDAYAIGEPILVNLDKVERSSLLIRFYCSDPNKHKIMWEKTMMKANLK